MQQEEIRAFFDRLAPTWDEDLVRDDRIIGTILDAGGVKEGCSVLDVGCGTGVLIPDYLARDVSAVTAVDLSPAMIAAAKKKCSDPRVTFVMGDVLTAALPAGFDCAMVYNAFPHFPDPAALIACLCSHLRNGGRLTVAHGMSRAAIDRHHSGSAHSVSMGLMSEQALAALFEPYFRVDVTVSDDEKYIVSGEKR